MSNKLLTNFLHHVARIEVCSCHRILSYILKGYFIVRHTRAGEGTCPCFTHHNAPKSCGPKELLVPKPFFHPTVPTRSSPTLPLHSARSSKIISQPRIARVQSALEANRSLLWQMKKRLVEGLQNWITDDANMQCL